MSTGVFLLVSDHESWGAPLSDVLVKQFQGWRALSITYSQCEHMLTPGLIESADMFLLGLMRRYSAGLRAEGIALALRLAERRKSSMVFSPLALADRLRVTSYWDIASNIGYCDQVTRALALPLSEAKRDFQVLLEVFRPLMPVPAQHRQR